MIDYTAASFAAAHLGRPLTQALDHRNALTGGRCWHSSLPFERSNGRSDDEASIATCDAQTVRDGLLVIDAQEPQIYVFLDFGMHEGVTASFGGFLECENHGTEEAVVALPEEDILPEMKKLPTLVGKTTPIQKMELFAELFD